jgi:hypothetical protein
MIAAAKSSSECDVGDGAAGIAEPKQAPSRYGPMAEMEIAKATKAQQSFGFKAQSGGGVGLCFCPNALAHERTAAKSGLRLSFHADRGA